LVFPNESYEEIEPKVMSAIKDHFKPEVLNRIGNNVIVYDFIRPEASKAIVKGQISKINARILKQNKVSINVNEDVLEHFYGLANHNEVLEMGGRGIGNLIEDKYINPLAEYIFEADCKEGDTVSVSVDGGIKFTKGA
jgi:ATP-dependent Clp protease ATP-binding subunit ClpA